MRRCPLSLGLLAALISSALSAAPAETERLLVDQGRFWQTAEKPLRAAEVWNKLLLIDSAQPDALYGLGLIAVNEGDLARAGQWLERLRAVQPEPYQARLLDQDIRLQDPARRQQLEEARLLVDNGEREQAAALYRQVLDGKPAQGLVGREYYNNLAFTEQGWSEARAGFERLMTERPDDPYVALFFAKHLVRREDTRTEGVRALSRLAKRTDIGGDADETWRLALTWIGAPDASEVPLFESFLQTHPDDSEIRELLAKGQRQKNAGNTASWRRDPNVEKGLKALERGELAAAEKLLSERLKAAPRDPDALGGMGVLRQRQSRLQDAEALLARAVEQPGGAAWRNVLSDVRYWALLQRASESQKAGQLEAAGQALVEAARLKPNEPAGALALADLRVRQQRYAEAETGYRSVLKRAPDNVQAMQGLIAVFSATDRSDEALALVDRLPEKDRAALGGLGRMRAELALRRASEAETRGDVGAQRSALEEALRNDPDNAWVRFALARLYVDLGAAGEARSLVDGLLATRPNDPDALYTSSLLSMQLGDWSAARDTLARIPMERRSSDTTRAVAEVDFQLQLQKIGELSKAGQYQEARAFLQRLEAQTAGQPQRQMSLASAYADARDPQRAVAMLRDLLSRSPAPDPALTLRYAGVLLQAGQDAEVASILRDLQGHALAPEVRKQYDDLAFVYRVRQAEQLREQGDLATAYDVLSPALAQRPQDVLAVSALARMYSANAQADKAVELYRPLLQRQPDDPQLQLAAADAALQAGDRSLADAALTRALALAPNDPQTLTTAARLYRQQGHGARAAELLRKVVAQEQRQHSNASLAASAPAAAPANPFAKSAGARGKAADVSIPAPASATGGLARAGATMQAQAGRADRLPGATASDAGNPFRLSDDGTRKDPRSGMSPAARALDDILQERSAFLAQGLQVRANDSESGLGRLTDVEAPFEVNIPAGDNRLALRVTPVTLNAGSVGSEAASRFGGGPVASASGASPGSQKDSGVGLAVAFERPADGLRADIGTTPQGFLYSTMVGGVSIERKFSSNPDLHWGAGVSRRALTDSLLSFAGTEDSRTGQKWGGVTANGGRVELGYDDRQIGAYAYGSWHQLKGSHVESNSRAELGSGVYWYLQNTEDSLLTAGLSLTAMGYDKNLGSFTYGHGGYFSPQSFFAVGVPVTWAARYDRLSVMARGSLGLQTLEQDDADYFPGDDALQAGASAALGRDAVYGGDSKTGVGYSLAGAAEYQLGSNFFLGGHVGLDNAQDYRQWSSGLYLRYLLQDQTRPVALPVSPYRSPYSN